MTAPSLLRPDTTGAVQAAFHAALARFLELPALQRVMAGELRTSEYASLLRQIFHHTRENPQMQALATAHFKGVQRGTVRAFLKHALSEVGHDQLAADDLAALGAAHDGLEFEEPLPETRALVAYGYHQIQFVSPLGYLGYLYFLEFTPTSIGAAVQAALGRAGVPEGACSFLHDHATIDVGHNALMERYLGALVRTAEEAQIVANAIRATGVLYGHMVSAAFRDAADTAPKPSAPSERS